MAQPELGTKRVCVSCSARFYDLGKSPAVCPKCGAEQPVELPRIRRPVEPLPTEPVKKSDDDVDTDVDLGDDADDDSDDVMEDTSDLDDDNDDLSADIEVNTDSDDHDQ